MNNIAIQIAGYNNARGFEKNIYCTDDDLAKQIESDEVVIKDYRYSLNVIAESEAFYSLGFSGNWVIYTKYLAYRWTTRKVLIGISIFIDKRYRFQANTKVREQLDSLMIHYIKVKDHELEGVVALRKDIFEEDSVFDLKEEREGRPVPNTQIDDKKKGCYQHNLESLKASGKKAQSYEGFIDELFDKKYAIEVKGFREIYLLGERIKFIKPLEGLERVKSINFPELPKRVKIVFREEGKMKNIIPRKVKMPHLVNDCMQVKKSDKDVYFGIDDLAYEVADKGGVRAADILGNLNTKGEYIVYLKPITYNFDYSFTLDDEVFPDLIVTYSIDGEEEYTTTDTKGKLSFKDLKYNAEIEILKVDDLQEVVLWSPQTLKFKAHEQHQRIKLESTVEISIAIVDSTQSLELSEITGQPILDEPATSSATEESDQVTLTLNTNALQEKVNWQDLKFSIKYRKPNDHKYYEIAKASQKINQKDLWFFLPFECEELKILIDKNVPYEIVGQGKDRVIPIDSLRRVDFKTKITLQAVTSPKPNDSSGISIRLGRVKNKILPTNVPKENAGVRKVSIQFILKEGGRISSNDFDLGYQVIGEKEATSIRFNFTLKDLTARFSLPQGLSNYKMRLMPKSNKFKSRKLNFPVLVFEQEEVENRKGKFQVLVYGNAWKQKMPHTFGFKSLFLILGASLVLAATGYFGGQALANYNNRNGNNLEAVQQQLNNGLDLATQVVKQELSDMRTLFNGIADTLKANSNLDTEESKNLLKSFNTGFSNDSTDLETRESKIQEMIGKMSDENFKQESLDINTEIDNVKSLATLIDGKRQAANNRFEDYRVKREKANATAEAAKSGVRSDFKKYKRHVYGPLANINNNEAYYNKLRGNKHRKVFIDAGISSRDYTNTLALAKKRVELRTYRYIILCSGGKITESGCPGKHTAQEIKGAKDILQAWRDDTNAFTSGQRAELKKFLIDSGIAN